MRKTNEKHNVISMLSGFTGDISFEVGSNSTGGAEKANTCMEGFVSALRKDF
jgi:hypothetical protein